MAISPNKKFKLSASRVKTYESCSALYYYKYFKKIPDETNTGAKIGSIAHLIFELLLKPRHRKRFDEVALLGTIGSKVLSRFCRKQLKKVDILTEDNVILLSDMVNLGLSLDYFAEGGQLLEPELEFDHDFGGFRVIGYIDRAILYDKIVKIQDYKTGKKKFKGDDEEANLQAMIYSLAARRLWPNHTPKVEFIFLRFGKDPIMEANFTDEDLDGLKYYLTEIQSKLENFTDKDLLSNVAKDTDRRWMCFAGKTWKCPYLNEFDYYVLLDKDGKVVVSSKNENDLLNKKAENMIIEKRNHAGCAAHKYNEKIDWFD